MRLYSTLLRTLLGIVGLCCLASAATAADFSSVGTTLDWDNLFAGARSEAMGQSDLAASRGPMAIFSNPAPLPEGQKIQVGYGNMDYFTDFWFNHYAASVEMGPYRFGIARMDFRSDSILIRTAFNPEGTGETFEIDDRVRVISAGLNIAELLVPGSRWDWTVGLAHRRYTFGMNDSSSSGLDFGSSARVQAHGDGTHFIASAAGALENVFNQGISPRHTRFGLALTAVADGEQVPQVLALTVAYTWVDDRWDAEFFSSRHYGLELTLLEALSFRIGHDSQLFEGSNQYGFGFIVPRQWIEPFGLTIDWGSMGTGNAVFFFTDGAPGNQISVTASLDL